MAKKKDIKTIHLTKTEDPELFEMINRAAHIERRKGTSIARLLLIDGLRKKLEIFQNTENSSQATVV